MIQKLSVLAPWREKLNALSGSKREASRKAAKHAKKNDTKNLASWRLGERSLTPCWEAIAKEN